MLSHIGNGVRQGAVIVLPEGEINYAANINEFDELELVINMLGRMVAPLAHDPSGLFLNMFNNQGCFHT